MLSYLSRKSWNCLSKLKQFFFLVAPWDLIGRSFAGLLGNLLKLVPNNFKFSLNRKISGRRSLFWPAEHCLNLFLKLVNIVETGIILNIKVLAFLVIVQILDYIPGLSCCLLGDWSGANWDWFMLISRGLFTNRFIGLMRPFRYFGILSSIAIIGSWCLASLPYFGSMRILPGCIWVSQFYLKSFDWAWIFFAHHILKGRDLRRINGRNIRYLLVICLTDLIGSLLPVGSICGYLSLIKWGSSWVIFFSPSSLKGCIGRNLIMLRFWWELTGV